MDREKHRKAKLDLEHHRTLPFFSRKKSLIQTIKYRRDWSQHSYLQFRFDEKNLDYSSSCLILIVNFISNSDLQKALQTLSVGNTKGGT